jgi:thymidylate synthase
MNGEQCYLNILKNIRENGIKKENRTGIDTYAIPPTMFQHDMKYGFPLLTTKKMGIKNISAELEFFIKGLTDKQWLKDRNCHIWDEWCNPQKVPYGTDEETKRKMLIENDLGFCYGFQWRNFNSQDYDQLKKIIDTLKSNPNDRRMLCSAWNPNQLHMMALPPCHVMWGINIIENKLNLWWTQRSVDTFLGLPYNIASYALLLKLICLETGFDEGILTGFLVDVHIYENHIEQVDEQLSREPRNLPKLDIINFKSIFDWEYDNIHIREYDPHPPIKGSIAI